MKMLQKIILTNLLVLLTVSASAQLTCDFSADTVKGCNPLRVNFADSSKGGGTIVYRKWDFGNGGVSNSNDPTPSRVYASSGKFTVTLTVSDGVDTATKTKTNYITVFKDPTVSFNYTKISNCPPILVNFTDQTTLGDAPIKTYSWDFGDLSSPGTVKNPSHTYNFKGTYSVILTVKDTNGCEGSFERKDIIVVDKPEAKFGANKRSDCLAPLTTNFTNNSTGKGPLTYKWFFGDGGTSTAKSPAHTYTTSGSFDVLLEVTDVNGCKDTLKVEKYIVIGNIKANFTVRDTICLHQPELYTNTSSGGQDYLWTFASNDTSTSVNPSYGFKTPGLKTVKLLATSGPNCNDSITKQVYVQELVADYRVSYPDPCVPNLVNFYDSSRVSKVTSSYYTYVLGTKEFKVTGLDTTVLFPASACRKIQRQVFYFAETVHGCRDTTVKSIVEYENSSATIQQFGGDHCVKDSVSFKFSGCILNGAKSYSWNFGTGKPGDTSNVKNPPNVIVLDTTGTYTSTLIIEDSIGCSYKATATYKVGEKPFANFKIQDDTLCYGEQFVFTSTSTDSTKIDEYTWEFGDAQGAAGKIASHIYDSLGEYRVKLIVDDNLCVDDTVISVYVSGPRASINNNNSNSCLLPLKQSFKGVILGSYTRFYWHFGDTSAIDSVNINPVHTYDTSGSYNVHFTAINDTTGCVDSVMLIIQPVPVGADIDVLEIGCVDSTFEFDGTGSSGNIGFNFYWDFDNGQTSRLNPRPRTKFTSDGIYNVSLIVIGADSCSDTAIRPVYVMPNKPAFTLPRLDFCDGELLTINAADSFGIHGPRGEHDYKAYFDTINNVFKGNRNHLYYFWRRQDTAIANNSFMFTQLLKVDSTKPKIGHQTDTLKLSLRAVDSSYHFYHRLLPTKPERYLYKDFQGCIQDVEFQIVIHDLNPIFRTKDSTICVGDSIWFQDTSQLTVSKFTWYFGDGDSSTHTGPKHAYSKRGVFNAKYVTEASVCKDSMIIPITVQGIDSLKFYASLTDTTCYPATTYFFDQSVGDSISWRYWDFGDGRSPIRSPFKDSLTKTFTDPGVFDIKLIVETSYGCQDSITYDDYIKIKGPFARFSMSDDSICVFDEVTFSLDTTNQYTYNLEWDFSNGLVRNTDTTVKQLSRRYIEADTLNPILVYRDKDSTCERAFQLDLVIEEVIARFSIDDTIGCKPHKAIYSNASLYDNQWSWKFGDKKNSSTENPENIFENEGTFITELIASNSRNGCKDTISKTVVVLPSPTLKTSSDSLICRGDSIQLFASGANKYQWSPISFMNNRNLSNPMVAPTLSLKYVVVGTDSNNCSSKDSLFIKVQQVPKVVMPNDTSIIIGERFTTQPNVQHGAKYRWEPISGVSCDTCLRTEFDPVKSTNYTLFITDSLGCFEVSKVFYVNVDEKYSVDVAEGFTPNGDGINDLIYPDGWGLDEILEFKVFNRWGEIVFESTPEQLGWDGYYKGELQNQETYLWFVKAISISGDEITKEGFFTLFR